MPYRSTNDEMGPPCPSSTCHLVSSWILIASCLIEALMWWNASTYCISFTQSRNSTSCLIEGLMWYKSTTCISFNPFMNNASCLIEGSMWWNATPLHLSQWVLKLYTFPYQNTNVIKCDPCIPFNISLKSLSCLIERISAMKCNPLAFLLNHFINSATGHIEGLMWWCSTPNAYHVSSSGIVHSSVEGQHTF